jgi:hypothetical protein
MQVPVCNVPPIFAPFAAEYTTLRSICWHRRDRITHQWQLLRFVQPCSSTLTGREKLVEEGSVDDTNDRLAIDDEGNRDAEHREEMGEVDGSFVELVSQPLEADSRTCHLMGPR